MKLVLDNLTKEFGGFVAVDHINLTMTNGVYGLLGVNGAGKTTLMRMLCTLLNPTGGGIYYDGKDIFQMAGEYRNLLGYLPQDFGFYPEFSVKDYLLYIAAIKGIRPVAARKRAKDLIVRVGLTEAADKKLKKLSGGMKRRVGIAQAMLNNPQILILDEPTAGLDPNERIRFRNLISELSEERFVLLSTHIVSDIEYAANEILMMKDGAILSDWDKSSWRCSDYFYNVFHSFLYSFACALSGLSEIRDKVAKMLDKNQGLSCFLYKIMIRLIIVGRIKRNQYRKENPNGNLC